MIVGDFEYFVKTTPNNLKEKFDKVTATVRKKHKCFDLNEDDIYHLGFVIEDIKRRLNLKRLM